MEYNFYQQSISFLLSLLLGIAFWFFYEILKLIRILFNIKKVLLILIDLLFMIVSSIATYLFALAFLNGSVRVFIVFGISLSFFITHFTIGKYFDKLFIKSICIFKKFFNKIINLFKKIIKKLLKILYNVLYNMFEKICKFVSFFKNVFKLHNLNKKGNKYGKQKERDWQSTE